MRKSPTSAMLVLTNACNLHCRYCFVHQHPQYMSLDTAIAALEYLVSNSEDKKSCSINFFGGEPLLLYDRIIYPLIQYANKKHYDVCWGITTNGILLNDEILRVFRLNHVGILMSIDGDRETQEYNRPCHNSHMSSFDLLVDKIPKLQRNDPDPVFRMTLIPDTCHLFLKNLDFAAKNNYKRVFAIPNDFEEWPDEKWEILRKQLYQYADYYIYTLTQTDNYPLMINPLEDEMKDYNNYICYGEVSKDCPKTCEDCRRCGVGAYGSGVTIDPAGDIYACQELASRGPEDNIFYIGNIFSGGIDENLRENLLNHVISDPWGGQDQDCEKCPRKGYCDHGCTANNYMATGSLNTLPKNSCIWHRMLNEIGIYIQEQLAGKEF